MTKPSPPRARTPGRGRRLGAGLVVASLTLLLLEAVASLLPLAAWETGRIDPERSIFVRGEGADRDFYVTSPGFSRFTAVQRFALTKRRGVFRVFVLGGSAVLGWPAGEECGATGFLRRALEKAYPGRFEIVNAAVMSYGSHRVLSVLETILGMDPDLVVVWTGNNEYVERNLSAPPRVGGAVPLARLLGRSHLYRALRAGVLAAVPESSRRESRGPDLTDPRSSIGVVRGSLGRTPEIDSEVLGNYRRNLDRMALRVRERGVPAIFCTVPVNLSGWVPAGAARRRADPAEARSRFELLAVGLEALNRKLPEAADAFRKLLAIDPDFAPGSFFLARALIDAGGEPGEIIAHLLAARDHDARVLRVLGSFQEAIRALPARYAALSVVDLERVFRDASGSGYVGSDLFLDYCHPTREGHKIAALALAPAISRIAGENGPPGALLEAVRSDDTQVPEERWADLAYARGMTCENNGDADGALEAYRETVRLAPRFPEGLLGLGRQLLQRGDKAAAEAAFLRALESAPSLPDPLTEVAFLRLGQGRDDEAAALARRALAASDALPASHAVLGEAALRGRRWEEAAGHFRRMVDLGAGDASVHLKLGDALEALGRSEEAQEQRRIAFELDPLNPGRGR